MWLQVHLVSGGSDGLLVLWSADHIHDSRELVPKISLKVSFLNIYLFMFSQNAEYLGKPCKRWNH